MTTIEELKKGKLPKHVGIIMDGNGRWAKSHGKPRVYGHEKGSMRALEIIKSSYKLEIPVVSLYAFSTENWKRPKAEIIAIMNLLRGFIDQYLQEMEEMGLKLNILGEIDPLPDDLKNQINYALSRTSKNDKMVVNIGLNYGGQDEIVSAAKKIAQDILDEKFAVEELSKSAFESYLYTKGQPPLDFLIRPSGELRVSNFMLYQLAYSEFWFSDIYWPDFTEEIYFDALADFQKRNRRFGGI